jgi:hypothetical protein
LLSEGLDCFSRLVTGDRLVVLRILLSLAFLLWETSCWVPLLTTSVAFLVSKVLLVKVALDASSRCSSSFLLEENARANPDAHICPLTHASVNRAHQAESVERNSLLSILIAIHRSPNL